MTKRAREAIDKMNEEQLRKTSSIHSHDKEIVAYIDKKLNSLNRDAAMAVETDMSDMGGMN